MNEMMVRQAKPEDIVHIAAMCHELWPDATVEDHAANITPIVEGQAPGLLPNVIFIAEEYDRQPVAFVDVDLRSHADGCDPSHSVGYIEGWYVQQAYRRKGIGARLIAAAEDWARRQGCREIASDTWLTNAESQVAHQALGFEVVDRCVHYRKDL